MKYALWTIQGLLVGLCFWRLAANLLALAQTLLISLLLARWLFPKTGMTFYPEDIAHLFGVAVPVFTSYLGHKYLTFKSTGSCQAKSKRAL